MINVTKTYLPNLEKFKEYVEKIYTSGQVTNNGSLVRELEDRLSKYLGVNNIIIVANGTLALEVAYKALNLSGQVITTPFTFIATASSLKSSNLMPVFADIDPKTFNIDPGKIENLITEKTSALLPVHVFGAPCNVEEISAIASRNNLKVIYDACHTFGVNLINDNGDLNSILNYGDISTLSFHATKLFHTIEGGAIVTNDNQLAEKIRLIINFGISGPSKIELLGINAKMNEFQAAMGLCVLDDIDEIFLKRQTIYERYLNSLCGCVQMQTIDKRMTQNFSYFPALFANEKELLDVEFALNKANIFPRRYFHPSLDTLDFLSKTQVCEVSRDIASRILCLPIYPELTSQDQNQIINLIQQNLSNK